ncbi:MAG: AAA family ATPase [candidate division WOR-3 bacterium]|nr:AAA family ATPase [candidate division WOR-3 bacterium]
MKIESVRIENLRSFEDETVWLDGYTCLVGPNGSGKSTVLCALNIFFRETAHSATDLRSLQEEDFHGKNTGRPIRVTVTFTDLSSEAQDDLKDYFRQDKLVVTAEAQFDSVTRAADVKQYGQRSGIAAFKPFFKALGDNAKADELKSIYQELAGALPELGKPGPKDRMTETLRSYESDHPGECVLIPSEDKFYGFSRGADRLAKHIQWVFVPAVKDAADEQTEAKDTALGKLLARTVRARVNFEKLVADLTAKTQAEYDQLLVEHQGVLDALSTSLNQRLIEWAHPDASLRLEWKRDLKKGVTIADPLAGILAGEGNFSGSLCRFGHGLQRSYLLALLQELATGDDPQGPRLILGCEEPELYQHPPQAKHMSDVFQRLCRGNAQIVVSTHSPYFVSGQVFESVRLVRKNPAGESKASQVKYPELAADITAAEGKLQQLPADGVLAKVHQELLPGLNEMFFAPILILVEGVEDVAYIATYMHLMGKWDDYRRFGCHVVPANYKSNMVKPLAIARRLRIPVFTILDSDAHETKADRRTQHERDNKVLLNLCGAGGETALPTTHVWRDDLVMWNSEIGEVVKADFDPCDWADLTNKANLEYGCIGNLQKNTLFIAKLLSLAWDDGKKSPTLMRLCDAILAFAERNAPRRAELGRREGQGNLERAEIQEA